MQSTILLFNTALARLGGEQLNLNISAQESDPVGIICRNLFPHVLDMALSSSPWAFATIRKTLASPELFPELAKDVRAWEDEPNPRYPHVFQLPDDCVKPLYLEGYAGVNERPHYIIEGRTLHCVSPRAVLVYVSRIKDPRLWPAHFSDALAWAMAGELASAVNNDAAKQKWAYENYTVALAAAAAIERIDQNALPHHSEFHAARHGFGGSGSAYSGFGDGRLF